MQYIYLAGPIAGLSLKAASEWREDFAWVLNKYTGAKVLSPLRGKTSLAQEKEITTQGYEDTLMSNQRAIVTRDRFDVQRSSLVIVNLLYATQVSIGTMVEIGWATAAGIPIIVVMEPEGNPHDHCFIRELANWIVPNLTDALHVAEALL